MDDQHGIGTCAEAETSVSVGRGREHAEARCYAQRGAAKKCAAGLLLLASVECVGWARLQGTEHRRAQSHRLRRAERKEGLCWRRRPQPTYAHTRMPASPSAQSRHPKTHGKACERNRLRTVMIGVGAAQGGAGVSGPCARRECVRAQGERAARAQSVHDTQAARLRSLSVGPSPICDLAFEKSRGGPSGEPARCCRPSLAMFGAGTF